MLIIDGTYLIYRSYYRSNKLRAKEEVLNQDHFNKIVRNNFLKILANIVKDNHPTSLFIAFDSEGPNYRQNILPTYKANRDEKPADLPIVKAEIYQFLKDCNFTFQIADYVEADDLIASCIHYFPDRKITIYSGDRDMGTLVGNNVTLLLETGKHTPRKVTIQNFHHNFPVPPSKFADLKALQGDRSDNVKGVEGLFRGQALHILIEYGSVENYLENGQQHFLYNKIVKQKDKILKNKLVTTMKMDCFINVNPSFGSLEKIAIPYPIAKKVGWFF